MAVTKELLGRYKEGGGGGRRLESGSVAEDLWVMLLSRLGCLDKTRQELLDVFPCYVSIQQARLLSFSQADFFLSGHGHF